MIGAYRILPEGKRVTINVKDGCVIVAFEEEDVYAFDAKGRLRYACEGGAFLKRGYDGRTLTGKGEGMRYLTEGESRACVTRIYDRIRRLAHRFHDSQAEDRSVDDITLQDAQFALDAIVAHDFESLGRDAEEFRSIYGSIPVLPPDRARSLYVKVTYGCDYNQCTFCWFFRGHPFGVQRPGEFRSHASRLRAYFGPAVASRQGIFLGDANALVAPQELLLRFMDETCRMFDMPAEFYAFSDARTLTFKAQRHLRALGDKGLKRIYTGLETGCQDLFAFVRKPGSVESALELIREVKACGIGVGIVILAGIGGEPMYHRHVEETARALSKIPLDAEDLVFISPLRVSPKSRYFVDAMRFDLRPLSLARLSEQIDTLKHAIAAAFPEGASPRFATYDIDDFLY